MTKIFRFMTITGLLVLYAGCQRELSLENAQPAAGYLVKEAGGDCLPATVTGTFTARQAVPDSNTLSVQVAVTTTGNYHIYTDTVNGYSFAATGVFAATGPQSVSLKGSGKPLLAGITHFTVMYDTSTCQAQVTVRPNPADPAAFTLAGAPDTCTGAQVMGDYLKGISTDSSNQAVIQVQVTTPGTYSVTTNAVNGYRFAGAGVLTATGPQFISLSATGTPATAGTNVFTITAGASACTFAVTVVTPVAVTNTDLFPLTQASHWAYTDSRYPNDSVTRAVSGTAVKNGNVYNVVNEVVPYAGPHPLFYRKNGTEYKEYAAVDKYTTSFTYSPEVAGDILFLKEGLTTGDSWLSDEFSGTASYGQVLVTRIAFSCLAANTTAVVNGQVFAHVYKIQMKPQLRSIGNNWGDTFEVYTLFYAKGIGLIYGQKITNGFLQYQQTLQSWLVN